MNLPNASNARVDKEKILEYLLSVQHPTGSGKARFFRRLGFTPENREFFAGELRRQGVDNPVAFVTETVFGPRYAVDGEISAPDGRNPKIRTIWQMDYGELAPRLITAYPLQKDSV